MILSLRVTRSEAMVCNLDIPRWKEDSDKTGQRNGKKDLAKVHCRDANETGKVPR